MFYSAEVVSTSTNIFYACFFFHRTESKLVHHLHTLHCTDVFPNSSLSRCHIICCISLHYFVGDRNSVGSVGSSRSTGSGQSSESTHNKQNESHLRTDMSKVLVYAFNFEIILKWPHFQYQMSLETTFFLNRWPPLLVNQENNSIKCQKTTARLQMEQWIIPILVIYVTCAVTSYDS